MLLPSLALLARATGPQLQLAPWQRVASPAMALNDNPCPMLPPPTYSDERDTVT